MFSNRICGCFTTAFLVLSFSLCPIVESARFSPGSREKVECQDVEGWHDSQGVDFDCDFYQAEGKEYCNLVGDKHGNFGLTANRACCACGGGIGPAITSATGWQLFVHRREYFWAVNSVELYSSSDCSSESRIQVPSSATFFDSGSRGGNWGPRLPFLQGRRWAGRKDTNGNFYLGVEFNDPVSVRCLRINQNGRGVPRIMVVAQKSTTSPWTNVKFETDLRGGWSTIVLENGNSGDSNPTQTTTSTEAATTTTSAAAAVSTTTSAAAAVSTTTSTAATRTNPTSLSEVPSSTNPIEVPAWLLPKVNGATPESTEVYCRYWDLSSIKPPTNPGYPDEVIDTMVLTGDEIFETAFYMMLYSNCERQVRGLAPFSMWSDDIMLQLQPSYVFESGHKNFGERAGIVRGVVAEGAGGGQRVGAPMPSRRIARGEDTISNQMWDPLESARVAVAGLVNHGDAMRDAKYTCVWATVTLGPRASNWMSAILLYGRSC